MSRIKFKRNNKLTTAINILVIILIILIPFFSSELIIRVSTTVLIYALLSMGNMIISGYTGMLNMGHAGFYGVGAYVAALLAVNHNWSFLPCLLVAGLSTGLIGLLISVPCLRVATDFLSLITIAFANLFLAIILNWVSVTRGPMGIPNIPAPEIAGFKFETPMASFHLILLIVGICYFIYKRILASKYGQAFEAVRDDEIAAKSVGIHINRIKVLAFTLGTITAGFAGCFMVHYIGFVGPNNFTYDESLLIMQMCIIGGLGSLKGAIVGAAVLTIIPEIFRPLAVYRLGINGLFMILCMLYRPQGILGSEAFATSSGLQEKFAKRRLRKKSKI